SCDVCPCASTTASTYDRGTPSGCDTCTTASPPTSAPVREPCRQLNSTMLSSGSVLALPSSVTSVAPADVHSTVRAVAPALAVGGSLAIVPVRCTATAVSASSSEPSADPFSAHA